MKLGISTASFFGREHVEATFEILRSMNVDNTEVFLNTFSEYEKAFVEALKERKGDIWRQVQIPHSTPCGISAPRRCVSGRSR